MQKLGKCDRAANTVRSLVRSLLYLYRRSWVNFKECIPVIETISSRRARRLHGSTVRLKWKRTDGGRNGRWETEAGRRKENSKRAPTFGRSRGMRREEPWERERERDGMGGFAPESVRPALAKISSRTTFPEVSTGKLRIVFICFRVRQRRIGRGRTWRFERVRWLLHQVHAIWNTYTSVHK